MKKIPKKLLDTLIYLKRLYWKDGEVVLLHGIHAVAMEIERECGLDWLSIKELISSIIRYHGLLENASNEKIYEVLNVLGWEVFDEKQESKSL